MNRVCVAREGRGVPGRPLSLSLTAARELAHEALLLDEGVEAVLEAGPLDLALALLEGILEALDGAPDAPDLAVRPARDAVLPAGPLKLVQGDAQGASGC